MIQGLLLELATCRGQPIPHLRRWVVREDPVHGLHGFGKLFLLNETLYSPKSGLDLFFLTHLFRVCVAVPFP